MQRLMPARGKSVLKKAISLGDAEAFSFIFSKTCKDNNFLNLFLKDIEVFLGILPKLKSHFLYRFTANKFL